MTAGSAGSPDYRAAVAALAARTTHGVRLGLQRTRELLEACGNPHERLTVLHVAGTNGKGSTCATLDAVLQSMGRSTAKYSSPHLIDFRERLLLRGVAVREDAVLGWLDRYQPVIDRLGATFFEATTAMAFDLIAEADVDVAIIEVGLGGRLDSTNVVRPRVATVTSIGLDHREFLGDSLEAIAREKAGIFKAGVPAVIGELDPAVIETLRGAALAAGASDVFIAAERLPVRRVQVERDGTAITLDDGGESLSLMSSLVGAHQAQNVATAVATLRAAGLAASSDALAAGVSRTRLAGRFQRVGRWLFDVAHNPDGIVTVVGSLRAVQPARPLGVVVCILADKDWRAMLDALLPVVDRLWLTEAPSAPAGRRWPLAEAHAYAIAHAPPGCTVVADGDFESVLRQAPTLSETVLVTGSFHTVGDAMLRLQIDPLAG